MERNITSIDIIVPVEIRSIEGDNKLEVKGLLPTNSLSDTLFCAKRRIFFKEKIMSGAFASALCSEKNIKLLKNHNYKEEFQAEFTQLEETTKGLEFTCLVENQYGLKKGLQEVRGLSFGFVVDEKGDIWSKVGGENIRKIFKFEKILEISILQNREPAYPSTKVIIVPERAREQLNGIDQYKLWLREQQLEILKLELKRLKK